jgi:hypothetical protein
MPEQNEETQDLHIAQPAPPDQNWARMQPLFIQPSKERLDRKHQLVQVKNTTDTTITTLGKPIPQKHVVIDRFNLGHELEPGQIKEVDMLVDDIEYFIRERKPGRRDHQNRMKPIHPIQIIGYESTQRDEAQSREEQTAINTQQRVTRERAVKGE